MKKVFVNYFQHMLEKDLEFSADISGWQKAMIAFLIDNDLSLFIHEIEKILHKYPDRMFENFKERNVQQIGEMIAGAKCKKTHKLHITNASFYFILHRIQFLQWLL